MSISGFDEWVVAFAVGLVSVRFLRLTASSLLRSPVVQRENYRGVNLPTAAGMFVVLGILLVEAGRAIVGAAGVGEEPGLNTPRSLVLFAVLGYGFLGLVDDLVGENEASGFRGHLGQALRGRLTTGMLKLAGGGALAVVLVATPDFATDRRLLVDAVVIALSANVVNLFDRAPGRAIKVSLAAYVPLALMLGGGAVGLAIASVFGGALALLHDDLRERIMVGDSGANVLGGVLGLGVVLGLGSTPRFVVLVVLIVLNVLAEVVSFSRVIERVPPLRALDHLGRRR